MVHVLHVVHVIHICTSLVHVEHVLAFFRVDNFGGCLPLILEQMPAENLVPSVTGRGCAFSCTLGKCVQKKVPTSRRPVSLVPGDVTQGCILLAPGIAPSPNPGLEGRLTW